VSDGPYRTAPARRVYVPHCEYCGRAVEPDATWRKHDVSYCDAFCAVLYLKTRGIGHAAIAELEETG